MKRWIPCVLTVCCGASAFEGLQVSLPRLATQTPRRARIVTRCSAAPWILGCIASGTVGVPFVATGIKRWYSDSLVKPRWTPNNRFFAPTWTVLYGFLGLAAFRVAQVRGLSSWELRLAFAHHTLNLLWAPVFFGLRMLRAGACINVVLLISLVRIIPSFTAAVPSTAGLLAPYAAWLTFATALNIQICRLNPNGAKPA